MKTEYLPAIVREALIDANAIEPTCVELHSRLGDHLKTEAQMKVFSMSALTRLRNHCVPAASEIVVDPMWTLQDVFDALEAAVSKTRPQSPAAAILPGGLPGTTGEPPPD